MDQLTGDLPPRHVTLPPELEAGIARALGGVPQAQWLRAAQALSARYRGDRSATPAPLASGRLEALGYAALIMPATYAQLRGATAAAAARIPEWQPRTLLDLGSGPGTALWAASAQWPSLRSLVAMEREPALIALGRDLLRSANAPALRDSRWLTSDLDRVAAMPADTYDLVVIGHVLNELSPPLQQLVVREAWRRTGGLLLIVEPGTSAAFPVVRAARDQLLADQAHTIAPCAHDQPCPLQNDWCHFPQRLIRPPFQRLARGAPSEWEDSKFCYAALARFSPAAPIWGRIIREPTSNKAYAEAKASTQAGIVTYRGLKRHNAAYRMVRKLAWGQSVAEPLPEPIAALAETLLP